MQGGVWWVCTGQRATCHAQNSLRHAQNYHERRFSSIFFVVYTGCVRFTLETDDFLQKHWIQSTKEYGLAHDMLRPGDWICNVNGIDSSLLTHDQIFEQCGAMNTLVTLMVVRESQLPPSSDEEATRVVLNVRRSFPEQSLGLRVSQPNDREMLTNLLRACVRACVRACMLSQASPLRARAFVSVDGRGSKKDAL